MRGIIVLRKLVIIKWHAFITQEHTCTIQITFSLRPSKFNVEERVMPSSNLLQLQDAHFSVATQELSVAKYTEAHVHTYITNFPLDCRMK